MHLVLVNCLGALSLHRNSVVRLTDLPDMATAVYRGRKATKQQQQLQNWCKREILHYLQDESNGRTLDKREYLTIIFLISH